MIRCRFIACIISATLFLNGCSAILEPVSFFGNTQNNHNNTGQEDFDINIQTLTFEVAKKANNAPYPRKLMLNGIGSKANVSEETIFLKSSFPKSSKNIDYHLGIGDEILFSQLSEFEAGIPQWPNSSKKSEYILGVGDQLTLKMQRPNNGQRPSNADTFSLDNNENDDYFTVDGVIGNNGSILLFGLGNILAANRTLDDVRNEVRNILIRDGKIPNFQLDISSFESQKVYIITNDSVSETFPLNILQTTLQEIALRAGVSESDKGYATVTLLRNNKEFRFTASQLFDITTPEIVLQNNDQIEIEIAFKELINIRAIVGSKGNILLGKLGSISAINRTLDDIHNEIREILIRRGIKTKFQLKQTKFASKKIYLKIKNVGSSIVFLTASNLTLQKLIFHNQLEDSSIGLTVVTLKRDGQVFRMTEDQILNQKTQNLWLFDGDHIEIEKLDYKPAQVYALAGAGSAQIVSISPSKRETLADILFAGGALSNLAAKRSEVYLLRGKNPSVAYHLDAQNVSRILVAAKTELRPEDILYVADRPIVTFSRTLSEIIPLRILINDIQNGNIP
jgi:protein involved in polysaccharide export with SLBB domain